MLIEENSCSEFCGKLLALSLSIGRFLDLKNLG